MAESITPATIAVTPGSGVLLDAVTLTVGTNTVDAETVVIRDPGNASQYAEVTAKGVQADYGLGIQDLHDSGRSIVQLSAYAQTAGATTTPTVITNIVQNSNWASSTGVTAFLVPTGTTLRLEGMQAAAMQQSAILTTTDSQAIYVTIRVATTNTTTALGTAPIAAEITLPVFNYSAVGAGQGASEDRSFGEGIEIPAGKYVGISFHAAIVTGTSELMGVSVVGYLY
jgi:hypothetical protein